MEHPDNFEARAVLHPPVLNNKNDVDKCACYALSFHDTAANSKEHFDYLVKRYCCNDSEIGYARFGRNIAEGMLYEGDGVSGTIEKSGHFNFHHVRSHNFVSNFSITGTL